MDARITWVEGRSFLAESGSGHALVIDGPTSAGGRNIGPAPMELVLLGAGGCSIFDVVSILQKSRQKVTDCRLEMRAERADAAPRVFTRIDMHFVVRGRGLVSDKVARAVQLSLEKYCSATAMLGRTAEIGHSFSIEEEEASPEGGE
ncbi:MAG: OsmC family protein [Geminicoccaceae bacterium]|nr:OsmC family protein [Geminicoccaceae bacterium]